MQQAGTRRRGGSARGTRRQIPTVQAVGWPVRGLTFRRAVAYSAAAGALMPASATSAGAAGPRRFRSCCLLRPRRRVVRPLHPGARCHGQRGGGSAWARAEKSERGGRREVPGWQSAPCAATVAHPQPCQPSAPPNRRNPVRRPGVSPHPSVHPRSCHQPASLKSPRRGAASVVFPPIEVQLLHPSRMTGIP